MGSLVRDHKDPGLLNFVQDLLKDSSLDADCAAVARKLLEDGSNSLSADERVVLENEIIEPYVSECEGCHNTPSWQEMLHVYDTGLCAACFDRIEGDQVPEVRPDWMPLAAAPAEDEELPVAGDAGVLAPLNA